MAPSRTSKRTPCRTLRHIGVREIRAEQVIAWLEQKLTDEEWVRSRPDGWFNELYEYLNQVQQRNILLKEKIKGLPLVLTRSGKLIIPSQAFFPPEKAVDPVLERYLRDFDSVIVMNASNKDVVEFLKWAGVREFDWALLLERLFSLEYSTKDAPLEEKPSPETNYRHLCIFKKLYEQGQIEQAKIREIGNNYPILRDRKGEYVIPSDTYLSEEYSTDEHEREAYASMERFYELVGGRPFVSPDYLVADQGENQDDSLDERSSKTKSWQKFFYSLGVSNCPKVFRKHREWTDWSEIAPMAKKLGFSEPEYTWGYKNTLTDYAIDGLVQVMDKIKHGSSEEDTRAVWVTMAWMYKKIKSIDSLSNVLRCKLEYTRYQRRQCYRDAGWVQQLRQEKWLLDKNGHSCSPGELWTLELEAVLGAGFSYLPQGLPSTAHYRDFASFIGVHFNAEADGVLAHLCALRDKNEMDPKRVRPVYEYLSRQLVLVRYIRNIFREKRLILVPGTGWFKGDEVCWRDPEQIVPSLEIYRGDKLKSFFCIHLGVYNR